MRKLFLVLVLSLTSLSLFSLNLPVFSQNTETITISTYYPSPVGIYRELRAQREAIGDTYYDASQYCWPPNVCANQINTDVDLLVEGNVGIGEAAYSKLNVHGDKGTAAHLTISGKDDEKANPPNENYAVLGFHDDVVDGINAWSIAHKYRPKSNTENALHFDYWPTPETRFTAMSLAANGNVGIGGHFEGNAPQAQLDVAGGVKIGNDATCDVNKSGTLRYNSNHLQYCDGTGWKAVGGNTYVEKGLIGGDPLHRLTNPPPTFNKNIAVPAGYTRSQCNVFVSMKYDGWLGQNKACGINVDWRVDPANPNQWQVTCQHRDGDVEPSWCDAWCNYQIVCQ